MMRLLPLILLVSVLIAACGKSPLPPPEFPPLMHTLVEDFSGTTINTTRWAPYDTETAALTTQNNRLFVAVPPSTTEYSGLVYRQPHRFGGSSFSAEVVQAASGGSLVETVVGVTSGDLEEYVLLTSFGSSLQAVYNWKNRGCNEPSHVRTFRGIEYCLLGSITFNAAMHRFRRLREQNGTVILEVSDTGTSWTQPPGWTLTHHFVGASQLHGMLAAGTPDPYPNTTGAQFDNVNRTGP